MLANPKNEGIECSHMVKVARHFADEITGGSGELVLVGTVVNLNNQRVGSLNWDGRLIPYHTNLYVKAEDL